MVAAEIDERVAAVGRKQRLLLIIAWVATLLPLIAFAFFTWQLLHLRGQVQEAEATATELNRKVASSQEMLNKLERDVRVHENRKTELTAEILKNEKELALQIQSTRQYRNLAGVRIRFYREADRKVVEDALKKLGFKIETELGKSRLLNRPADTITYGNDVSEADLRDIAVALVEAGFPLRYIAPSDKPVDGKLIQIIASVAADKCGALTVDKIRAGKKCG